VDEVGLVTGDEIAVFNTKGICCGAVVWEGSTTTVVAYGAESNSTLNHGFAETNDVIYFKIWVKQSNREYNATVTYNVTDNAPNFSTYISGGIYQLSSLQGTDQPPPEPLIVVTPTPLAFGGVTINSSSTQNMTIINSGNAELIISQVTISGNGFTLQNVTTPINIVGGVNRTMTVQFSPTATTNYTGTVTLSHNATGSPTTIPINGNGTQIISVEEPTNIMGDGSTFLFQNSPNPVKSGYDATISYKVNTNGQINLIVYDLLGREMAKIVDEYKSAGIYSITFNTKGLPSGVYFYKLRAPGYEAQKKMLIIR
jgi:hypothetical protein